MNTDTLKNFIVVAELENMTKAAEQLHMSQSALSRSMIVLESELGCELFSRKKKEIHLNDKGKIFLESAKRMLHQAETTLWDEDESTGTVKIGLSSTSDSLNGMIVMFKKRYPNIAIRLYTDINRSESIFNRMDFLFVSSDTLPEMEHIRISEENAFFALMNTSHPLAGNQALDFRDLADQQLIFAMEGDGNFSPAYDNCLKEGFIPNASFIYEQNKHQLELICNTDAIAIVTNTFKSFRRTIEGIKAVPLRSHYPHSRSFDLVKHMDNDNPAALLFWKVAQEYLQVRTTSRQRGEDIEDMIYVTRNEI